MNEVPTILDDYYRTGFLDAVNGRVHLVAVLEAAEEHGLSTAYSCGWVVGNQLVVDEREGD